MIEFLGYCQKWLEDFMAAVEPEESHVWLAGDNSLDILPVTLTLLQA